MNAARVMEPADAIALLVSPEGRQDPYPIYEAIRGFGNLVPVKPGLVAVLGYDECVAALRDKWLRVQDAASFDHAYPGWREHSSLRGFTNSMLYTNPPDHTRLRGLMSGAFTARRISSLQQLIERTVDHLLDRLADIGAAGSPLDFMTEFAFRLPIAVISEMLGVPTEDQEWLRAVSADVVIALEGISSAAGLDPADRAMDQLSAYFVELIERRRWDDRDDLLGALIRAYDGAGDRLTLDELVGNLVLLLTAGFDTTTHLLGHGLRYAIEHPRPARRLRADPEFAAAFVEETLRLEPPVQATSRWAATDLELRGTRVPAGTKMLVLLAAANRDPRRFHEPARFEPDRPDNKPLSFADGPHVCLGALLARREARIALPRVLRRFPGIAAAGNPSYRDRWLVRGHDSLPITI